MNLLQSLAQRATASRAEVTPRVPALFEPAPLALTPTEGVGAPSSRRRAAVVLDDPGVGHLPVHPAGPDPDPPEWKGQIDSATPSDVSEPISAPPLPRGTQAEQATAVDPAPGVRARRRSPISYARTAVADPPPVTATVARTAAAPVAEDGATARPVLSDPAAPVAAVSSPSGPGAAGRAAPFQAPVVVAGLAAALPVATAGPAPSSPAQTSVGQTGRRAPRRPAPSPHSDAPTPERPDQGVRSPAAVRIIDADAHHPPAPLLAAPPPLRRPAAFAPPSASSADDRGAEPAPAPTVSVTIGRIDVRAVADSGVLTPAQLERAARRALSLEEYLRQRSRGRGA